MKVYHVCSLKKLEGYIKAGEIKPPVRAWCDIYEAVRFSCSTGRFIILRLKFPDDVERCPGHRGNAVIQYTPFKIKDFLEHLPAEKKAKCETVTGP